LFFWPPGSGKTLGAAEVIKQLGIPTVVITLAPTRKQFAREIVSHTPHCSIFITTGETAEPIPEGTDVVITSYEILPNWFNSIQEWSKHPLLIIDESHKAKSWKRVKRTVVEDELGTRVEYQPLYNQVYYVSQLAEAASYRLLMTATPVAKDISDLWAQLNYMNRFEWKSSVDFIVRYLGAVAGPHGGFVYTGLTNQDELKARLAPYIHKVTKVEVQGSLPAIDVGIHRFEKNHLKRDRRKQSTRLKEFSEAKNSLEALLMDACERAFEPTVEYILSNLDGRLLIFGSRHKYCLALYERLQKEVKKLDSNIWLGYGTGETSHKMRELLVADYNRHDRAVLVCTIGAFGTGIDGLQHTDRLIFAMIPPTPKDFEQSRGRVERLGSSKERVVVRYLVGDGTYSATVMDTLIGRLETVGEVFNDEATEALLSTLRNEDPELFNDFIFGE